MITERDVLIKAKAHGLTVKGTGVQTVQTMLTQIRDLLGQMMNMPLDKVKPLLAKYMSLVEQTRSLNERISNGNSKKIGYDKVDYQGLMKIKFMYRALLRHWLADPNARDSIAHNWAVNCRSHMNNANIISKNLLKR